MPACILYIVPVMKMVELHQWNTNTALQVVEFTLEHISECT